MKTTFLFVLSLAFLSFGCASRYDITLTNGEVLTAKGKPHLNADKSAFLYTDTTGKPGRIPASRVNQVAPQSLDGDNPMLFNPAAGK